MTELILATAAITAATFATVILTVTILAAAVVVAVAYWLVCRADEELFGE